MRIDVEPLECLKIGEIKEMNHFSFPGGREIEILVKGDVP